MQFVKTADDWLRTTVIGSQDDAHVTHGPVVRTSDGMLAAVHIIRAHFHGTEDKSVTLDFKNTTWYCDGASELFEQAYKTGIVSSTTLRSDSVGNGIQTTFLPVPGQDSSGNPSMSPPPSPSSSSNAPSTVLLAAVASGCAGAKLQTSRTVHDVPLLQHSDTLAWEPESSGLRVHLDRLKP